MENRLQHKLFNYQAQPPVGVWNKINVVLDEEASKPFSERLANYEQYPAPFLWDNIVASLDENDQKVIPLKLRFSKPLRYSTAAACLIAVAVLITLLINKKSVSNEAGLITRQPSTTVIAAPQKEDQNINGENSGGNINRANRTQEQSKISPIRIKKAISSFKRSNYVLANTFPKVEIDMPERYIIYASSSGDAFRISKKLFDLFACSDVNEKCRENIELMQQQVASPGIMTATDFSGLLDLLQSINNQ
jgi:hypothetical protein